MRSFESVGGRTVLVAALLVTVTAIAVGVWTDSRFASSVLAIVGLPLALGGAASASRRRLAALALAAFAADLALIAYWIYDLVSTVHRGT
jgi:hypothetical protein